MELTRPFYNNNVSTISAFNPNPSDSDIPLQQYDSERGPGFEDSVHQRWDETGRAVGYASDPRLHAPQPRPPSFSPSTLYASPADAVAVTLSRDSDNEWFNAQTPKTTQPPDVAFTPVLEPLSPSSRTALSGAHAHTLPLITSPFPPPPQSPTDLRRKQSPGSPLTAHVTYEPDLSAISPASGAAGTGAVAVAVQEQYYPLALGSEPPREVRTLSPPPTYQ
jgi:hypothetical protein